MRREFEQLGNEARLVRGEDVALGMATCALRIDIAGQKRFHCPVSPVECAIPAFGEGQVQQGDRYFKVEVLSQPASAGHDLMVLNRQQISDDIVDCEGAGIEGINEDRSGANGGNFRWLPTTVKLLVSAYRNHETLYVDGVDFSARVTNPRGGRLST